MFINHHLLNSGFLAEGTVQKVEDCEFHPSASCASYRALVEVSRFPAKTPEGGLGFGPFGFRETELSSVRALF